MQRQAGKGRALRLYVFGSDSALVPAIVLDAIPRARRSGRAFEIAREMKPTPPFEEKRSMSAWSLPRAAGGPARGYPAATANGSEELRPSWHEGRCQRKRLARIASDLPAATLSGGDGPRRGQQRRVQRQIDVVVFDRQYSPFIFHYQGPDDRAGGERLCCIRGQAIDQCGASGIRSGQGRKRPAPPSHQFAYPLCEGDISSQTIDPILGGLLTFESDWTPAFGEAPRKGAG